MTTLRSTSIALLAIAALMFASCSSGEQVAEPAAVGPTPTEDQMNWHEMEMNAFIHFTTNTFTDLEWGYGDESPSIFNPSELDAEQWVSTLKDAGFKGVILTTKHHDGFCLWPSQYTEHSVKNSPYKDGKGDVVREVSDACKKYGLKFGVYLSPWDRNMSEYGSEEYITYYRNQLEELLTGYGDVFEMWFDGANGGDGYYGGARETRKIDNSTYYEWPETIAHAKQFQPNILFFSDAGPDIRWIGNESGFVGETNWNTLTPDTLHAGKHGITKLLNTGSEDGTHWIPGEVDVSIRPGWFYHAHEDDKVKTPEQLLDIYLTSVGRGSVLLLNMPPDRRGLIHENDVESLKGFRELLDKTFANNLVADAKVSTSNTRGKANRFAATNLINQDKNSYWATDDGVTSATIDIDFNEPKLISYILMQEYIKLGQRVKQFSIEAQDSDGNWQQIYIGTTIGYKRIAKVESLETSKVRIHIQDSKAEIVMSNIEVY